MGLDTVEVVINIEKKYKIEISDEDAASIATIGEIAAYIVVTTKLQNNDEYEFDDVVDYLKNMIHKDFDVPLEKIEINSHVVFDLGLD